MPFRFIILDIPDKDGNNEFPDFFHATQTR